MGYLFSSKSSVTTVSNFTLSSPLSPVQNYHFIIHINVIPQWIVILSVQYKFEQIV